MGFNFTTLGGLFSFSYINDVEDMDLDALQEAYADIDEEYQGMKNDCKELKKELDKLKDVIERKNPEAKKEKIRRKLEADKVILHNEDVPYEVRMKYIIDAYRKDQVKWGKLAAYAKHLEGEVIRLKNILITNGYSDSGVVGDSDPAKVIKDLKEKIKVLESKKEESKDVTAALSRIKDLENQIETFPMKVYKSQDFKKIIYRQEQYIKELQSLLDENGVEYQSREPANQLEIDGVEKVVDECVRYGKNFKPSPLFVYSSRQSMRLNFFKSLSASCPLEKELVKIVYSMMCSQEIGMNTQQYRSFIESGSFSAAEQMKKSQFAAFAPCAIFSKGKERENVTGLTDLCYLEFVNIKDEKRIINAMNILRNDKNVLLASRSVSNEGLHVLVSYKLKDVGQQTQEESMTPDEMQDVYAKVYNYLADKYLCKLGLLPDYKAGQMDRLYIVSYDPELYYNPNAERVTIDLEKSIIYDGEGLVVMNIGGKIREAEEMTSKGKLDEAEALLLECRESVVCNTIDGSDETEMLSMLDDYLSQVRSVKKRIARVNELMDEVDEDLRNQDTKTAHEKIFQSQHILKSIRGTYRYAIDKTMKRVVDNEMIMGAINRELKKKREEESIEEDLLEN